MWETEITSTFLCELLMPVEISVAANDLSDLLCINTAHAVLYLVIMSSTMEIFIWLIRCMVDILQKFFLRSWDRASLTPRLLMSYIYGAPSKARNANVVYIWTYVGQR